MGNLQRPIIGINVELSVSHSPPAEIIHLASGYCDAVYMAHALPILMPPYGKTADIDAILDHAEGFLLVGGPDLKLNSRGGTCHPALEPMPRRRQDHDTLLIEALLRRRTPILAVGVGMQHLNVFLGGTLFTHLPEDQPRAFPHRDNSDEGPHRHAVHIKPATRLHAIYGDGELLVNSDHHQAVHEPGKGLRISARAPDGVVEAIEHTDENWFCVGVQWHPEKMGASALDRQLLDAFIHACTGAATTDNDTPIAA